MAVSRRRHTARVTGPTSLRALARLLKVSDTAVRKGIQNGRLVHSVGQNGQGRPVIVDVALARREWHANAAKTSRSPKDGGVTLAEAQRLVAMERADGLRLVNEQTRKTLIPAEAAKLAAFEFARTVRESVLNVTSRVAGELAAETDAARLHVRLDAELRLALEATAQMLADG